ncbi:hypothetical protein PC115_g6250 [Phytophthora cactorum]|uniref:MULE transposase domain-containing protein n=1 Tax=Phytophthora cactorum TaxID=29920 RepID=A0A8T1D2F8_9STRA|nr:hypothetical protein PC115_g6250 [Phytophthora cactorum]
MSSPHTWNLLCSGVSSEDAAVLLQGMMKWKKVKSQLMSSTSCSSGAPHSMRYRLLCCACKHCADAVPYLHCAWRLKVLVCQEAATVDMHELGDHHCRARTPSNSCITLRQRHFIKELARENLVPMRIRHALGPKFGIRPAALPSLRTVQNIVHHFRRTRLGGNDKRKAIMEAVRASAFSGRDGDHDAFTFTSTYDGSVVPEVGNGSDARPFLVGMTTKALLRNSARDPGTFVLHLDATFKLITSQLQREHCAAALVALRCMYARVNGAELQVKFVLGDADKAQHKAFHDVFADRSFTYLMCFYHVVAKLRERSRGLSSELSALVYKGVYDLQFARSEAEFVEQKEAMLKEWAGHADLTAFTAYVKAQRQLRELAVLPHTARLKMGLLLAQLLACCGHRSMALPLFSLAPTCPSTLQTRTRGLRRRGLLSENVLTRSSINFLLGDADPDLVHVRAVPPMRTSVPELNRTREDMAITAQFGVHYARMEFRSVVDDFHEEILVNRKRVQNVGRPQNIDHALQRL